MDKDVMKYIPGMAPISYQGQIDFVDTKEHMPHQRIQTCNNYGFVPPNCI